jgi:hypothetical protein
VLPGGHSACILVDYVDKPTERARGRLTSIRGNPPPNFGKVNHGTGGRQNEAPQIAPLWELSPETVQTRDGSWRALGIGSIFDAERGNGGHCGFKDPRQKKAISAVGSGSTTSSAVGELLGGDYQERG